MSEIRYNMSLYRTIIFTTEYCEFKKWLNWAIADKKDTTIIITKKNKGYSYGLVIYKCQREMLKYFLQENLI